MTRISISAEYDAGPPEVWRVLEPIESHVDWMADAEIDPVPDGADPRARHAVRVRDWVGPIRLTDRMEITEWDPERVIGVRHDGLVTGTGRFTLRPVDGGRTHFQWDEELTFPWWLGGRIGERIGGQQVMRRMWIGNLRRLRTLVERRP